MSNQVHRDTDIILSATSGLPPVSWLLGCTQDQQRWWDATRRNFQYLYAKFKTHFTGQPFHVDVEIPPNIREILDIYMESYIVLYMAIQRDWEKLSLEIKNFELPEANIKLSTPGEVLCSLLYLDCWGAFSPCLEYSEFTPRPSKKNLAKKKEIEALASKPLETLTLKDVQKIESWIASPQSGTSTAYLLLAAIEAKLKMHSRSDPRLRTLLKRYCTDRAHWMQLLASELHPRKGVRGHKWVRGQLLNISQ